MLPRGMLPAGVDGARSTPTRAQLSLANHVAASFKQLGGGPLVDEDGGVAATRERRNYPATFPTHKREREREREREEEKERRLAMLVGNSLASGFLECSRGRDLCNNRSHERGPSSWRK